MVKTVRNIFTTLAATTVVLCSCSLLVNKDTTQVILKVHLQNCVGISLSKCTTLLTNDFLDEDSFADRWYESYSRSPHQLLDFKSFFPFMDSDSQGKSRLSLLFWENPEIEGCLGYKCDRRMELHFFTQDKIPLKSFVNQFHNNLEEVHKKSNDKEIKSYIYSSSRTQYCANFILRIENNNVESITMHRYKKEICSSENWKAKQN